MIVRFDEADHAYYLDGVRVPSVTQCLQLLDPFESVSPAILEAARQFGHHGHKAMALLLKNKLDWAALDPALKPYIEAGAEFLRLNSDLLVTYVEKIVASKELGVAGTIDLVAEDERQVYVIEWKFTSQYPENVGPQTDAYKRMLISEAVARDDFKRAQMLARTKRWCVVLGEGKFETHVLNDPADWPDFLSCLNVTKRRWRYGIGRPGN